MGPGASGLLVQGPVGSGHLLWCQATVPLEHPTHEGTQAEQGLLGPVAFDHAVDDDVRDVHPVGREFVGQAGGEGAQRGLGGSEGRKQGLATQGRGGPRHQDAAPPPLGHALACGLGAQDACQRGHTPVAFEEASRCLQQASGHVQVSGVEHHELRDVPAGVDGREQGLDRHGLGEVAGVRVRHTTRLADGLGQRFQLGRCAADQEDRQALFRAVQSGGPADAGEAAHADHDGAGSGFMGEVVRGHEATLVSRPASDQRSFLEHGEGDVERPLKVPGLCARQSGPCRRRLPPAPLLPTRVRPTRKGGCEA